MLMIDATHLKAHRTAASPLKKGSTPRYRTQPGRADYQTVGGLRRQGAAAAAASERGTGQRSQDRRRRSRAGTARQLLLADRAYSSVGFRQGAGRSRHHAVHSSACQTPHKARIRPSPLPTAPQDREHVRPAQRLASHPQPLRSMRSYLPVSHCLRRSIHLLDQ